MKNKTTSEAEIGYLDIRCYICERLLSDEELAAEVYWFEDPLWPQNGHAWCNQCYQEYGTNPSLYQYFRHEIPKWWRNLRSRVGGGIIQK